MKHFLFCIVLLFSSSLFAGEHVSVGLINATKGEGEKVIDPKLKDIKTFNSEAFSQFKEFKLIKGQKFNFPVAGSFEHADLKIDLSGSKEKLQVTITKDKKKVMNSTFNLATGKPLLTVLPTKSKSGGKLILLLLVPKE